MKVELVHIPKCAGTYIKNMFENVHSSDKSLSCKLYRKKYGDCSDLHVPIWKISISPDTIYIAIVRDPVKRFLSTFNYDISIWKNIFGEKHTQNISDFIDFLYNNNHLLYKHSHLFPQSYFITKSENEIVISDYVVLFSFDMLPFQLIHFLDYMNIKYDKTNIFEEVNSQQYNVSDLSDDDIIKIKFLYKIDYELLSSSFL